MRNLAVPKPWFLAASIAVIAAGVALGAVHLSFHGGTTEKVRKGLGIALVLAGAFAAWSYKLTPRQKLPYVYDKDAAFAKARHEGKGVMIDFSATWCVPCRELELTFANDEIYDPIVQNFVPLKFDVSNDDETSEALRKKYHAETLPAVVFRSADDDHTLRHIDHMMEPDEMKPVLGEAITKLRAGTTLAAGEPCQ